MKVLDLRCSHGHAFEGWFASEADYLSQHERAQVACPLCGDTEVARLPSAPRLNVSGAREPAAPAASRVAPGTSSAPSDEMRSALQGAWLAAVRHVLSSTVDVGERFPEEARRIHYGETPERAIRGQATAEQAQSLRDEGIEVMALPVPAALKGPLQ